MLSKILLLCLIVSISKVESTITKGHQYNASPSNGKPQGKSQSTATAAAAAVSTAQSGSRQPTANTAPRQTQTIPAAPSGNAGVVASPRLQLIPGQGNLQTIPFSQLTGPGQGNLQSISLSQLSSLLNQQRGVNGAAQNYGLNAGLSGLGGIQAGQIPQLQTPVTLTPPNLGLKPSLNGPSSVITGPVSAITIPPSQCATVIDNSLANSLANALQLFIAYELINSGGCNNINSGYNPISAETLVPGVDLNSILQTGSQICGQAETAGTPYQPEYYDWGTILKFLNQQNEPASPVVQAQPDCGYLNPELTAIMNYITQNGNQQQSVPRQQQSVPCQQQGASGNPVIDAIAAYMGCSPSEVSSCTYPTAPEIQFPLEIPAQLVCNYGYMPTVVPVVTFDVQSLTPDGFIIGPQCPC